MRPAGRVFETPALYRNYRQVLGSFAADSDVHRRRCAIACFIWTAAQLLN